DERLYRPIHPADFDHIAAGLRQCGCDSRARFPGRDAARRPSRRDASGETGIATSAEPSWPGLTLPSIFIAISGTTKSAARRVFREAGCSKQARAMGQHPCARRLHASISCNQSTFADCVRQIASISLALSQSETSKKLYPEKLLGFREWPTEIASHA